MSQPLEVLAIFVLSFISGIAGATFSRWLRDRRRKLASFDNPIVVTEVTEAQRYELKQAFDAQHFGATPIFTGRRHGMTHQDMAQSAVTVDQAIGQIYENLFAKGYGQEVASLSFEQIEETRRKLAMQQLAQPMVFLHDQADACYVRLRLYEGTAWPNETVRYSEHIPKGKAGLVIPSSFDQEKGWDPGSIRMVSLDDLAILILGVAERKEEPHGNKEKPNGTEP